MSQATTNSGVDVLGNLAWGTHLCHFYETVDDLLDVVAPFFEAGLKNNEFCVWIVNDPVDIETAVAALKRDLPVAKCHLTKGDLHIFSKSNAATNGSRGIHIVPHTKWYLSNGRFDGERVRSVWHAIYEEAMQNGYAGVRAAANESWLNEGDWGDFVKYEGSLDSLLADLKMLVVCSYPMDKAKANSVLDLVGTHEFALARRDRKWEIVETPDLKEAKNEIQQLNNELEQRVADRTEQVRSLAAKLDSAREEESARIAREIHDELGGELSGLRWDIEEITETVSLSAAEESAIGKQLRMLIARIDTMVGSVRRIASELRPTALDEFGLAEALRLYAKQFEERTGCTISLGGLAGTANVSTEMANAMFRIVQEALTNVLRHAAATRVDIDITPEGGQSVLTISDNGRGIRQEEMDSPGTFGLVGMRERAELLGGELDVEGCEGRGTTVTLRVPAAHARSVEVSE